MDHRERPDSMMMVHQWAKPRMSCRCCRDKKRRCDRLQPCSNCKLRNVDCEYPDDGRHSKSARELKAHERQQHILEPVRNSASSGHASASNSAQSTSSHHDSVLERLSRLEHAVFDSSHTPGSYSVASPPTPPAPQIGSFTPFGLHALASPNATTSPSDYVAQVASKLPPLMQARLLFNHNIQRAHFNYGVMHIPSARDLLENAYSLMHKGEEPDIADLLLLFTIFCGSALTWTPQLLKSLNATESEAKTAGSEYLQLAHSIMENESKPVEPSTTALIGLSNLGSILVHIRGPSMNAMTMRLKAVAMARAMQLDRLDTEQNQIERSKKGFNHIELEVQRRSWWSLVASDWLGAFAGGPNEGTYMMQPRHMNTNFPREVDDDQIKADGIEERSAPMGFTDMAGFMVRIRMAEMCREIVDILPPPCANDQTVDYSVILEIDQKWQDLQNNLPLCLRMDPTSLAQCEQFARERPMVVLQRLGAHLGINMRISKLHRPYHFKAFKDPKYTYSRTVSLRAAHAVLDIRNAMEELGAQMGIYPARSWIAMQHVFVAALTVASEVSWNPNAAESEERRRKVLTACQILEQSSKDTTVGMEGVQKNIQTLMSTLNQKNQSQVRQPEGHWKNVLLDDGSQTGTIVEQPVMEQSWDELFNQFLTVAPDLDMMQWDSLLSELNTTMYAM